MYLKIKVMRHFKLLLSVLISFISIAVTAQNKDVQAEAAYYFDSKDYKKAYELYDKLYTQVPKNFDYKFRLAYSSLFYPEKKARAVELFEDIKKTDKSPDVDYYLAKAYHVNYKFDEGYVNLSHITTENHYSLGIFYGLSKQLTCYNKKQLNIDTYFGIYLKQKVQFIEYLDTQNNLISDKNYPLNPGIRIGLTLSLIGARTSIWRKKYFFNHSIDINNLYNEVHETNVNYELGTNIQSLVKSSYNNTGNKEENKQTGYEGLGYGQ